MIHWNAPVPKYHTPRRTPEDFPRPFASLDRSCTPCSSPSLTLSNPQLCALQARRAQTSQRPTSWADKLHATKSETGKPPTSRRAGPTSYTPPNPRPGKHRLANELRRQAPRHQIRDQRSTNSPTSWADEFHATKSEAGEALTGRRAEPPSSTPPNQTAAKHRLADELSRRAPRHQIRDRGRTDHTETIYGALSAKLFRQLHSCCNAKYVLGSALVLSFASLVLSGNFEHACRALQHTLGRALLNSDVPRPLPRCISMHFQRTNIRFQYDYNTSSLILAQPLSPPLTEIPTNEPKTAPHTSHTDQTAPTSLPNTAQILSHRTNDSQIQRTTATYHPNNYQINSKPPRSHTISHPHRLQITPRRRQLTPMSTQHNADRLSKQLLKTSYSQCPSSRKNCTSYTHMLH